MESGNTFEVYPGLVPEHEAGVSEREQSPESQKTESELMLAAFESGSRFEDEDEKARDYNARLDKADEIQDELNDINESIGLASRQLMGVSLTPEQQRLLYEIEQLMAQRKAAETVTERDRLNEVINQKTEEFSNLPVTTEQGGLLDEILKMMVDRTEAEERLSSVLN